jgi:hypothetical protein
MSAGFGFGEGFGGWDWVHAHGKLFANKIYGANREEGRS